MTRLLVLLLALPVWPLAAEAQVVTPKRPRPVSEFLRPPGSSESSGATPIDWSAVPEWRQASFYGIRAQGQVFAFVLDASGSMADAGRMARAKAELRRSVAALRWPQRFVVIFYNDEAVAFAGGLPQPADARSKAHLAAWLNVVDADGPTDPRPAMKTAIGIHPDAVFLLSDGEFPDDTAALVAGANRNHVPIHTIHVSGEGGGQLEQIARDSGGECVHRP
jgi:uncharacterized protein with von Willebrand factor type A (vWA) domain